MTNLRRFFQISIIILLALIQLSGRLFAQLEWQIYNSGNTPLLSNYFTAIAISDTGIKWIGTGSAHGEGEGLYRFDGETWTHYNLANAGLPTHRLSR